MEAVICAAGVPLPELPAQVRVAEVGDVLLASIADTQSPQGIVFICKGKSLTVPQRHRRCHGGIQRLTPIPHRDFDGFPAALQRLLGYSPALTADDHRRPVQGDIPGAGPGQCRYNLAHCRRLWGGWAHFVRRLRRPVGA